MLRGGRCGQGNRVQPGAAHRRIREHRVRSGPPARRVRALCPRVRGASDPRIRQWVGRPTGCRPSRRRRWRRCRANRTWTLPGGKAEADEAIEQAVACELAEETGLLVTPTGLAHVTHVTHVEQSPDHAGELANREIHKHLEARWVPASRLGQALVSRRPNRWPGRKTLRRRGGPRRSAWSPTRGRTHPRERGAKPVAERPASSPPRRAAGRDGPRRR
ncbi:NUDIX hydrolase [Streptomyces sp. ID05-18]|nr:NUDIX hydrolase [Streptomyces sp. ID05-18]MDX3484948.1 NUDIX hydrolase [Streptomyces sp. ID05-18]